MEAIDVRAVGVRITLVRRFFACGNFDQPLPKTLPAKHSAFLIFVAIQFQQMLGMRASGFKYRYCTLGRFKWARRIGVWKTRQSSGQLRFVSIETGPRVAEEMIDDRP